MTVWSPYPPPLVLCRINNLATVNSREQAKQRTYTQQQSNKGVAGRTSMLFPGGVDFNNMSNSLVDTVRRCWSTAPTTMSTCWLPCHPMWWCPNVCGSSQQTPRSAYGKFPEHWVFGRQTGYGAFTVSVTDEKHRGRQTGFSGSPAELMLAPRP